MTEENRLDDRAIRVLMDVLIHDINNHIHGSTGYLELMDHVMEEDPTQKRFLRNALSEMMSVSYLVENVGLLLNIPKEPFQGEPVDLYSQMMTAGEMADQRVQDRSLDIQTTLKHGEVVVHADRFLLNALIEILSNSLMYDSRETVQVWISAVAERDKAVVVIGDQGKGIPDDQKEKVLERYWRSIMKEDVHGKGMGLSVVKMVMDRYGGSIRIENRVPEDHKQGTKVIMELPLSKSR